MAPSGVFGEEQAYLFDLMGVSLFTRRLRQQCVCCCAPCMTAPVTVATQFVVGEGALSASEVD
jgi:hypothetical protein